MASLEAPLWTGEISPRFDKLLKDVVDDLSPEELKYAVSSIKTNFEKGKFADKGDQDLYSCLHLFANQGLVSEDNLTLLEKFVVTPVTSKKEGIEAKIRGFKATRLQETEEPTAATRKELTGRHSDLVNVMSKLRTAGGSSVLNLYGSSGVGKTRLATEVLSQCQGAMKFKVDLRDVERMEYVHFQVLQALGTGSKETTTVSYEANPVIFKMRQLRQRGQGNILLLLDNVDQFSGGSSKVAASLNDDFVLFLQRLIGVKTGQEKSSLKILLTSRSAFRHGVENYEVKGLERVSSGELLQRQGTPAIHSSQRERLVEMCRGKPLLLNGMASILRQEIADAERLLGTIEQELEVEPSQDAGGEEAEKKETFDAKGEGIDEEQLSCLRKMFFFLPSKTLKESAVSVSLFCRPFSLETASKILSVNVSEAAIRIEGLRNSQVVSVVPEAKERLYDIHPLMRKFLKSIGNRKAFVDAFQKAKDNFCNHFLSKLTTIAALLDKEFVKAFDSYDFEKLNFELALDISLKSSYLLIPRHHQESVMICYLLDAMLNDQKQRRKIFHAWAEKVEEDGKEGSMFRAEMRCWEALQVLNLEGWHKAAKVVQEARELLKRVQRKRKKTEVFKFAKSSCLFVEGEVFNRAGNWPKALKRLSSSLEIMEDQLKNHTSTCRCLNAIGNCYSNLGKPEEAIKFYTRAYEMRQTLSGSEEHFDFPLFRSQIGTAYEAMAIQEYNKHKMTPEAKTNFRKAIEKYQEALDLAKELKLTGILYTALYNRNIANAHSWLMEFEKAKPFAYNGYQILKDILGKHPLTAQSTFQMAENSRSLEAYDEAEAYYEEAWEIEKSLGQGNQSEERDRIIKSYEGMLPRERKRAFQKEVLEFYQRLWEEEKSFEGFQFSQANMRIIDAINERLGEEADFKSRKKYQNEALWFYEGAWNSPDTKKLPYEQREHILRTLLRLCKQAKNEALFNKYQEDSVRFYDKMWKKNSSEMEQWERTQLLTVLQNTATSLAIAYTRKADVYKSLEQKFKMGKLPFGASEQCPDDDDNNERSDDDNDDDDSDDFSDCDDSDSGQGGCDGAGDASGKNETNDNIGSTEGDEITKEQELPQKSNKRSQQRQVVGLEGERKRHKLSDDNLPSTPEFQVPLVKNEGLVAVEFPKKLKATGGNLTLCSDNADGGASNSLLARRPLRVTTVGDEWGSSKGGLSTLNRELAKHLALQPEVEVTCLLLNYSEEEEQEAGEFNVRLAKPQAMPVSDPIMWLCFPSDDLGIDVVIGHGQKLGAPAQIIANRRKCKRVHIVHTASEELAMFKEGKTAIPEGEEKHRTEIDLCREADVVVAIGPKLKEAISAYLRPHGRDEHVIDITPGIFSEFTKLEQARQEREQFRILVFGRGNLEDTELKGYDIAAEAVASLKDESYLLQFVGALKGKEEEVKNRLLKCGIPRTQLSVRKFAESRDKIKDLLLTVDLAILPSRTEGFGLAALEALSAGLPILVGNNSGFGKAIRDVKFGSSCVVCSDDPEKWAEAIKRVRKTTRKLRLEEACSLREAYDEKYKWETQCEMLVQKLRHILE